MLPSSSIKAVAGSGQWELRAERSRMLRTAQERLFVDLRGRIHKGVLVAITRLNGAGNGDSKHHKPMLGSFWQTATRDRGLYARHY